MLLTGCEPEAREGRGPGGLAKGPPGPRRARAGFALVVGLLVLYRAILATGTELLFRWEPSSLFAGLLAWAAVVLVAAASGAAAGLLAGLSARLPDPAPAAGKVRVGWVVLLVLIVAAGAAVRFARVAEAPPGLWVDVVLETETLLGDPAGAPRFWGIRPLDPTGGNHAAVSGLYLGFVDLLFRAFGRGDAGFLAISALPGALVPLAAAWLGFEIAGAEVALLAAVLTAFGRWPSLLSRWGWTGSALVPLALLASAATLAAIRRRSPALAVAAGLFGGLALHTHPASVCVVVALGLFALSRCGRREERGLVLAAAAGFVVAVLPLVPGYLQHPAWFGGRGRDVSLFFETSDVEVPLRGTRAAPLGAILHNAGAYGSLLVFADDPNPRHALPARPLFAPWLGLAVLLSVGDALARPGTAAGPRRLVLFLSAASLAAGILSSTGGAPNTFRTSVLAGLLPVLAAPLLLSAARASRLRPALAVSALSAALLAWDVLPVLLDWPEIPSVRAAFGAQDSAAGRRLRVLGKGPVLVMEGGPVHPEVVEALAASPDPRVPVARLPRVTRSDLAARPPAGSFWLLARVSDLAALRDGGWRCRPFDSFGPLAGDLALARVGR